MSIAQLLDIAGLRDRTTPRFRYELWRQASEAGLSPSYIAAVMRIESNFDPHIQNKGPDGVPGNADDAPALGLIQFWETLFPPIVARAAKSRPELAGTKWNDLRRLSAVEQLPFVIAYYEGVPRLTASSSPTDYYMATFMPAFIDAPPTTVLGRKGDDQFLPGTQKRLSKIYTQNAGLDVDKDGTITVADIGRKIEGVVNAARARAPIPVEDPDDVDTNPGLQASFFGGGGVVLLLVPAFFLRGITYGANGEQLYELKLRKCAEGACPHTGTMADPAGTLWCQAHYLLATGGKR